MRSLVVIPAYNEEMTVINTVNDVQHNAGGFDVIVVNDGSSDNTEEILSKYNIPHISHVNNLGIGGAVQTGYRYGLENNYDVVVQIDADGQHDPKYLSQMLKELNHADLVIGSRFLNKEGYQSTAVRRFGIRFFMYLLRRISGQMITDPTSGFRMCNRKIMKLFAEEYPRDYPEPETVYRVIHEGGIVSEIPVKMRKRQGGMSSIKPVSSLYYMVKVSLAILVEGTRKLHSEIRE